MYDREVVASIAKGDPVGLGAAYDQYAASLYTYSRSLLAEPDDAADAVRDTFVIAWIRIGRLRDPDRLRAWLFAVARNESHGRLRAGARPMRDDARGLTGDGRGAGAEPAEPWSIVQAALTGLNPREREVVELNVRHKLDDADLSEVLGMPHGQGQALAARARSRFKALLGVLLLAWSARGQCREVAGILDSWDGTLSAPMYERLTSHNRRCPVCGAMERRKVSPAALIGLLPAAVLPGRVRKELAGLVTGTSPEAREYRDKVAHRAERFTATGFPVQITSRAVPRAPGSYALAAAAAVTAVALLGGGTFAVNYTISHSGSGHAAGASGPAGASGSSSARTPKAHPSPSSSPSPAPIIPAVLPAATAPKRKSSTKASPKRPKPTSRAPTSARPTSTSPSPSTSPSTSPSPSTTTPTAILTLPSALVLVRAVPVRTWRQGLL